MGIYVLFHLLTSFCPITVYTNPDTSAIRLPIPWGDEVATYMFVLVRLSRGSCLAAKMSSTQPVSFHFSSFRPLCKPSVKLSLISCKLCFNGYFVYLSYDFVFNEMNLFWKSQTTGIPKLSTSTWFCLSRFFFLMMIRIIWNNYERLFKGAAMKRSRSERAAKMTAQSLCGSDHRNDRNRERCNNGIYLTLFYLVAS